MTAVGGFVRNPDGKTVIIAATKSSDECMASAKIPRLPVAAPTMIFSTVNPKAAAAEPVAARDFSFMVTLGLKNKHPLEFCNELLA